MGWAVFKNITACVSGGLASEMRAYAEHLRGESETLSVLLKTGTSGHPVILSTLSHVRAS